MGRIWIYPRFAKITTEVLTKDGFLADPSIIDDSISARGDTVITKVPRQIPNPLVEVTKDGVPRVGFLVEKEGKTVTIIDEADRAIFFPKYDFITYLEPETLFPKYVLDSNTSQVEVSYRVTGLNWSCKGSAYLDDNNNLAGMKLTAIINNNLHPDVTPVGEEITLVSANVPREDYDERPTRMMAARSAMAPSESVSSRDEGFKDYMLFPIETELTPGTIYLPLIAARITNSHRVYFVEVGSGHLASRLGYIFDAPQDLPEASLDVVSAAGMFLANTRIEERRAGENVRIYLGTTTTISGKGYLTTEEIPKGYFSDTRVEFKVVIANNGNTPEKVIVRYYVGSARVTEISCKTATTEDGYLEIQVEIGAGANTQIECSFVLKD